MEISKIMIIVCFLFLDVSTGNSRYLMKFQRMNSSTSLSNDCDWKRIFRSLVNSHIQTNQWIKFIKEGKKKDKGKNKKISIYIFITYCTMYTIIRLEDNYLIVQ